MDVQFVHPPERVLASPDRETVGLQIVATLNVGPAPSQNGGLLSPLAPAGHANWHHLQNADYHPAPYSRADAGPLAFRQI